MVKNILVVKYTPAGERSNSRKLMEYMVDKLEDSTVDLLDLEKEVPIFFDESLLGSYVSRNYVGNELREDERKQLEKFDNFLLRFKKADVVIFAYPTFNFSFPGSIKTFFDMILQKGETWDMGEKGFIGLCPDKQIVNISTAGAMYDEKFGTLEMNHNTPLMKVLAGFLGAKYHEVFVEGINMFPDRAEEFIQNGKNKIDEIVNGLNSQ